MSLCPPPPGISQTDDSDAERLTKTPPGETQANLYNSSPPTGNFSNLRFRCIRAHKDTSLGGPTLILITLPPPHQEYRKPTIPLQRDSQKPLGRPRVILITLPPPDRNISNRRFRFKRAHKSTCLGRPKVILITLPLPHTGNISNRRFCSNKKHNKIPWGTQVILITSRPPPPRISQTDDSAATGFTKKLPWEDPG